MKVIKNVLLLIVAVHCCESSFIKIEQTESERANAAFDTTEAVYTPLTEEYEDATTEMPGSLESSFADETPIVDMLNGKLFRLKMTIEEQWNNDFMDTSSAAFKQLASSLGSELIDFIDNSKEAAQPNMTSFKLVEVQPSHNSIETVYVTFVISSVDDISGREVAISLSNQINLYGVIYITKVTNDGFVLERISEEDVDAYSQNKIFCHSGEPSNEKSENAFHNVSDSTLNSNSEHEPQTIRFRPQCKKEAIDRGSTQIYIFEHNKECIDGVLSAVKAGRDDFGSDDGSAMMADELSVKESSCARNVKNIKRSTQEAENGVEEETVVVVRKRGGKVFLEL